MASADGRITIEIELEDGTVQRGLADIGNQADKSGGRITSAFGKAGSALKTVGKVAVGVVAGVTALTVAAGGLSVPLVKAAAEAQALDAQFSTVFGKLEKNAQETIDNIGKSTGINSDRLKASFTQIAAFSKTTGTSTADALDLSRRSLIVAADSAAFYDKSLESVTESLQSFLKGNFENDAALGISATETTRNAVATRLFAKEFKGLSEAQKQVALLTLVEEGNKLGGALGQAARESDGLENVLGNLRQAYENFKIALGGAILDTAITALKTLTSVINNIDTGPIVAGLTLFVSALQKVISYIRPFLSNLLALFKTTLSNVRQLWESEGANILSVAQTVFTSVYSAITFIVNEIVPVVQLALFRITAFWNTYGTQITTKVTEIFNLIKEIVVNVLPIVVEFVRNAVVDIANIWDTYFVDIFNVVTTVLNGLLAIFNFALPAIQFVVKLVWDTIVDIIEGALGVITGVVDIFVGIFTLDFELLWEGIKTLFTSAIKLILGLVSLSFLGGIKTAFTTLVKNSTAFIKNMWQGIKNIFVTTVNSIRTTVSTWITNVLTFFRNLYTNAGNIITNLWQGIKNTFATGVRNALQFVTTLKNKVVETFEGIDLFQIGKDIIQGLINGIGSLASSVGDVVEKLVNKIPKVIREVLNINSPSRVTTELGEFTGEGIAVGLDKTEGLVTKASSNLAKAAIPNNLTNKLSGTSVNVGRVSSGGGLVGTNALNTSTVDNSKSATYNINLQNDKTAELERTLRRIQFAY